MANGTMSQPRKARKAQGFKLVCPMCGDKENPMTLDLSNLTTLHCTGCEDDIALNTAIKILTERLRQFEAVAAWVALAGDVMTDVETDAAPDNES